MYLFLLWSEAKNTKAKPGENKNTETKNKAERKIRKHNEAKRKRRKRKKKYGSETKRKNWCEIFAWRCKTEAKQLPLRFEAKNKSKRNRRALPHTWSFSRACAKLLHISFYVILLFTLFFSLLACAYFAFLLSISLRSFPILHLRYLS
jgi:hypothetical protein